MLLNDRFLDAIHSLIMQHHTVYPRLPPQGIFFEALVERAFHLSGAPGVQIVPSTTNAPAFDVMVADQRFSIKSETGKGTHPSLISITKLCTTEREPWTAETLVQRVIQHLSRYDHMIMLRAIWPTKQDLIHYQLLEIPMDLLKLIAGTHLSPVGRRSGRRSLGGDVTRKGEALFHVHFDGSDGKCQVRNLRTDACQMLRQWDQRL